MEMGKTNKLLDELHDQQETLEQKLADLDRKILILYEKWNSGNLDDNEKKIQGQMVKTRQGIKDLIKALDSAILNLSCAASISKPLSIRTIVIPSDIISIDYINSLEKKLVIVETMIKSSLY